MVVAGAVVMVVVAVVPIVVVVVVTVEIAATIIINCNEQNLSRILLECVCMRWDYAHC